MNSVIIAFLLTIIAGLSTGIGSLIAYFIKKPKIEYLSFALGLSGGVMTYISFVELLPQAIEAIGITQGVWGEVWGISLFFIGVGFMWLIDLIIPEVENPHHIVIVMEGEEDAEQSRTPPIAQIKRQPQKELKISESSKKDLMKTGLITAFAIAIHNFPEGLVTFGTALRDTSLGIVLMIAIAIHNIPEGISVSIPIYYATGNKKKAFWYSFLSGAAEPVGAALGYLILFSFLNDQIIGGMLGFIAGVMVYISLDEILPTAQKYDKKGHLTIAGIVVGMLIMAMTLLLL
ncbi:MAG: zinc transporter ZupT [Candidatus Lokiarchaeota archaeon]|nr:zinc transporter ZupT [Candidatus Lokiarchaeota archaeon]